MVVKAVGVDMAEVTVADVVIEVAGEVAEAGDMTEALVAGVEEAVEAVIEDAEPLATDAVVEWMIVHVEDVNQL